jgi:iron complex outermembrane receptor protein
MPLLQRFLLQKRRIALAVAVFVVGATGVEAQEPEWLRDLEELMQIEITSAARREHKVADTAAAVFVLTRDDIRRSGLMTVPELLRLVPGVQVAQIDANKWAVSVRGFNSRWANKLLVMINGRSIYSRLFSGVFWDALSVPVAEIERIEVIRGPGGSLWGANAVNGVINIITRTPETRQGAVSASVGTLGTSSGSVHYGAAYGGWLKYNAYLDASHQGSLDPGTTRDDWRHLRVGVGAVATLSARDEVRVEARALDGDGWSLMDEALNTLLRPGQVFTPTLNETAEFSAAARWTRTVSGAGSIETAASIHDVRRDEGPIRDVARVLELTFQHTAPRHKRNEITWGLVTQRIEDRINGTATFRMNPDVGKDNVFGAFAQDEIGLWADRVTLTLGAKLERLQSSGWHWQPTARARWNPTEQQTVWMAVSRAVRTPSLVDRGLQLDQMQGMQSGIPVVAQINGDPRIPAESLRGHELGYRWATRRVSIDLAGYHNLYEGLSTIEPGTPRVEMTAAGPRVLQPGVLGTGRSASSTGAEILGTVTPASWVRVVSSYTLFTISSRLSPGNVDRSRQAAPLFDADTPRHQGMIRSLFSLPHRLEVDNSVALVGRLQAMNLPGYVLTDVRIGWKSRAGLDLAVVAQNLLDDNHLEFRSADAFVVPSEARRRVWTAATWRF